MFQIRPFCNSDPPGIVDIWRSHLPLRGLMQPMSVSLLEQQVFSRPYFQREGFLVAEQSGTPIGFAHAAFGPTDDHADLSHDVGVTCMLMTLPHGDQPSLARALLERSESYLRAQGAAKLLAGGLWPVTPFYLGLYGGSSVPGVLASDTQLVELFQQTGYEQQESCEIWQRELSGFRVRVDRRHMQIRREYVIEAITDEPLGGWWEACLLDQAFHVRFQLARKSGGPAVASATFWDMEPLASGWGIRAMGLVELEIAAECRRQGLGSFLISEAIRQLQAEGVTLIECQSLSGNQAARRLWMSLGFHVVETGTVLTKVP